MSNYERYHQISKEAAAACNLARAAATQAYDRAMKPAYEALRAGKIDQPAHTRLMLKADRQCDKALQRANKAYDLVMSHAWKEQILGESTQGERQLLLWKTRN